MSCTSRSGQQMSSNIELPLNKLTKPLALVIFPILTTPEHTIILLRNLDTKLNRKRDNERLACVAYRFFDISVFRAALAKQDNGILDALKYYYNPYSMNTW